MCIGTPHYLKARYGSGYKISVQKSSTPRNTKGEEDVAQLLKELFKNIKQVESAEQTTSIFEVFYS